MSLAGIEFAQFAESQPDIWASVQGASVVHAKFGVGIINTVNPRNGSTLQVTIRFSSEPDTRMFNSAAFKTGLFTNIQIPNELLDSLTACRERIANEKVKTAAAAQKKKVGEDSRQKNNVGKGDSQKTKKIECCHGPFLGPALLARHVRIAHGGDISVADCRHIYTEKQILIPIPAENPTKLKLLTRSPSRIEKCGRCDLCNKSSTNRWLFKNTTRGEAIICTVCRDRIKPKPNTDILDSGMILPGHFGG